MSRKFAGLLSYCSCLRARAFSLPPRSQCQLRALPVISRPPPNPSWLPAAAIWTTARSASPRSKPASRRGMPSTTLQAFDTALVVIVDAENRAGLAEQTHPSKPFRDAAQTCEQEVSRVLTDISLDKEYVQGAGVARWLQARSRRHLLLADHPARLPSRRR